LKPTVYAVMVAERTRFEASGVAGNMLYVPGW